MERLSCKSLPLIIKGGSGRACVVGPAKLHVAAALLDGELPFSNLQHPTLDHSNSALISAKTPYSMPVNR